MPNLRVSDIGKQEEVNDFLFLHTYVYKEIFLEIDYKLAFQSAKLFVTFFC